MSSRPSNFTLTSPGRLRLYSTRELLELPPPEWLVDNMIPQGGLVGLYGQPGKGKAQPLDEKVLTPDGWALMGDLKVGSLVIGSSGLPIPVMQVHPQGDLPEWEVSFSDGAVVRCCGQHLWQVQKGMTGIPELRTTETLTYTGHHKEGYWHVPMNPVVSFRASGDPLPLDPYLLGALLGDGGLTHYAGFTTADDFMAEEVRKCLPPGCELTKMTDTYAYKITTPRGQSNPVWTALRLLGLAGQKSETKFVPPEYLYAPAAERLALLQGLLDTDGYAPNNNKRTIYFTSASRNLTEAVRHLVLSLGGQPRKITVKHTQGLDAHCINFRPPAGANMFRLPRKANRGIIGHVLHRRILRAAPTGRCVPMQCITVASADGLYITNDFVVTHNSFIAIDLAMCVATGHPWQGIPVRKGYVLYIAAEGGVGITQRVRAWLKKHELSDVSNIAWLTESISVNNDVDDLNNLFARIDNEVDRLPSLVIIDTLARCFDGDENAQEDMGRFIAGVDRMRLVYGATVVIVHHTNVSGKRERGNTAFRGAADTMIALEQDEDTKVIEVFCSKQKDAVEFPTIELVLEGVPGTDSAVVSQANEVKANIVYGWICLGPAPFAALKARVDEEGSGVSLATLKRKLRELLEKGKIVKNIEGIYDLPDSSPKLGSRAH